MQFCFSGEIPIGHMMILKSLKEFLKNIRVKTICIKGLTILMLQLLIKYFQGGRIEPMSFNKSTTLLKPINYQQSKAEFKTQDFRGDGEWNLWFCIQSLNTK